jgi:hypothetical protein
MKGYEDYIVNTPERFKLLPQKAFDMASEYGTIIAALSEGAMTVKEIHGLFKNEEGKHSKTLKTVYRHLETLEKEGLVMLAGHRKYEGKRTVEKLYTRTAKVFFQQDPTHKEAWLSTEQGKRYMEMYTELTWKLKGKEGPPPEELREAVTTYFRSLQIHVNEIIDKAMTDEDFSDAMDKYNLKEIKSALSMVSQIQTTIKSHETIDEIKKILD